jgi:hypothetical protein
MPENDQTQSSNLPGVLAGLSQYILGFAVYFAVGLAPFLGTVKVPGFEALLNLVPDNLRDTAIPISAFLMGIVGVLVQRYSDAKVTRHWQGRQFSIAWKLALAAVLALVCTYTFVVVPVESTAGGSPSTIYVQVGFYRPHDAKRDETCPPEIGDAQCLSRVTLARERIDSFWGDANVRLAALLLQTTYWAATSILAWLIGLLLLGRTQAK